MLISCHSQKLFLIQVFFLELVKQIVLCDALAPRLGIHIAVFPPGFIHAHCTHFPLFAVNPDGHVNCLEAEHSVEVAPFLPLHFHFQLLASSAIS